jgi:hypothetical protein
MKVEGTTRESIYPLFLWMNDDFISTCLFDRRKGGGSPVQSTFNLVRQRQNIPLLQGILQICPKGSRTLLMCNWAGENVGVRNVLVRCQQGLVDGKNGDDATAFSSERTGANFDGVFAYHGVKDVVDIRGN